MGLETNLSFHVNCLLLLSGVNKDWFEALCYKSEGRGYDSQCGYRIFQLT
jgi:hypothetical protein